MIEDGDYVAAHAEVNLFGSKKAVFDIFRFENGKIVEHWDNLQDLAAPNPSRHSLVDGATEVTDLDKTETNKALINQFYKDVFMGENPAAFPTYFNGDNYTQHNPMIGDGVSTVMKAFQEFTTQGVISGTLLCTSSSVRATLCWLLAKRISEEINLPYMTFSGWTTERSRSIGISVSRFQRKINGKMKTGSFKFETKGRNLSCLL